MIRAGAIALLAAAAIVAAVWLRADASAPMARFENRSPVVTARDGTVLRAFLSSDDKWRLPATREDVDPLYLAMLMAYEDQRFEDHAGVDWRALARAGWQAATSGRVVSGASTLSMQAARLLDPAPRGLGTKLREMRRARALERRLGKDGVLSVYLTLAPFGGNLEGVRAASLAYFGKEPAILTTAEAALLTALPKNPNAYRPDRWPARARMARGRVLDRAVARGVITARQADLARAEAVPRRRLDQPFLAPHAALLAADGRTTIDARLQRLVEARLKTVIGEVDPMVSAAALVVHRRTADIHAYVGTGDYYNRRRGGMIDMVQAVRSPGSALKPFVYGLAFDRAIAHPLTLIDDRRRDFDGYDPRNFDHGTAGQVTAAEALQRSLNIPAVAVLGRLGPGTFDAAMRGAGVAFDYGEAAPASLAIALGGAGVTLADLTRAYVALDGGRVPDRLRLRADDPDPAWSALMNPRAAWMTRAILSEAPRPGGNPGENRDIAFKTGTSFGFRDAWALGLAGDHAIGVWVGRPDGAPCHGCVGLKAAAPVLLDIARMLPRAGAPPRAPAGIISDAGRLSPALRRLGGDARRAAGLRLSMARPVEIAFPRAGVRLALPRGGAAPLRASGGVAPLRWRINGRPLGASGPGRSGLWRPDGPGWHRIEVIDATGAAASALVGVDMEG